jgi:DNA invertase Pin-like site-specific DNA recombinase
VGFFAWEIPGQHTQEARMIDPAIIAEIKRLLAEEMPQREIARRLHVSRGLVAAVAVGKRPTMNRLGD